MMIHNKGFRISKWYLDCVGVDGSVRIIYIADLHWGLFAISYSEILEYEKSTGLNPRHSLGPCDRPQWQGDAMIWTSSVLGIDGSWNRLADPVSAALLSSDDGDVSWHCHLPAASGVIRCANCQGVSGHGYVEQLDLTIKPWDLPIDELRWGRFFDGANAIVWIDWKGAITQNWVFHNGRRVSGVHVSDDTLSFAGNDMTLSFRDRQVIRDSAFFGDIAKKIPMVEAFLPKKVHGARECKWLSRGTLSGIIGIDREGWVIHEVVTWK